MSNTTEVIFSWAMIVLAMLSLAQGVYAKDFRFMAVGTILFWLNSCLGITMVYKEAILRE